MGTFLFFTSINRNVPISTVDPVGLDRYNLPSKSVEDMGMMKLKRILLFALGVAVVVAGVLAVKKRSK